MWRPAVVVFGVSIVACWHDSAPRQTTIGNHAAAGDRDLAGVYRCTITEDDYKYPPFPCAIRATAGRLVLSKLGGSVRFEGDVHPDGEGFSFDGRIYCPFGDCTERVAGTFRPAADGSLQATLGQDRMVVQLQRAGGAYGGAGYGGLGYGGAGYGGASYGGMGYGGASYGGTGYGGAQIANPPPPPAPGVQPGAGAGNPPPGNPAP